ncbi:MAG: hypothetical protein H7Z17_03860 [Fuerstia sp.]|nr:hypothetical protein [Fuerstiella sp.]
MRPFRHSILIVVGAITLLQSTRAQDAGVVAEVAAPPLVTRFYDITLLTTSWQQFPFDGGSGIRPGATHQLIGGFGGGGGGGFSLPAESLQGGGGFFSLPMEPTQFGGGAGGLGGGAAQVQSVEPALTQQLEERGESLSNLIVNHIDPPSWTNSGVGTGEITELSNTLIVRQTESVHQQVAEFLKSLTNSAIGTGTYRVEAWWIPATEPSAMQLKNLLSGKLEEASVLEQLAGLCEDEGGYHGTLLCRDRITTHMTSGKKVPVIIGSTPVVGTGSAGHSPTVQILHLGLMLEARVTTVPDFLISEVDGKKSDQVELNFRSQVTGSDAHVQDRSTIEKIDRYELGEHIAAGSCRIRIGTPRLIASLTRLSNQERHDTSIPPELNLVVRVTRLAE